MTEETRKLFDAPWKAEEYKHGKGAFVVRNNGGYLVAENMSKQDAQRLARLPELYEALAMTTYEDCFNCYCKNKTPDVPSKKAFMENGCPFKQTCDYADVWKLLKKVRDGI